MSEVPRVDVVIAGAGLAGASLAARLAAMGREVVVLERNRFPREKLCGEFLAPESVDSLEELGIADAALAGAPMMTSARITSPWGGDLTRALPRPAWGVARFRLDALLAATARRAGAEVHESHRVTSIRRDAHGFVVEALNEGEPRSWRARTVIDAAGRERGITHGTGQRSVPEGAGGLVAFRHLHRPKTQGPEGVEVHAFAGGYCGVGLVENGLVNVCFLARTRDLRRVGGPAELLARAARSNRFLAERLAGLEEAGGGVQSVARMTLSRRGPSSRYVLEVGDAAAMIAPACGDGMAMALRSAVLAAPLVVQHLDGVRDWDATLECWRAAWHAEFDARLRAGAALQAGLVRPHVMRALLAAGRALPVATDAWIRATRG